MRESVINPRPFGTPSQLRRLAWHRGKKQYARAKAPIHPQPEPFTPEHYMANNPQPADLPDDLDLREELRVRMASNKALSQATIAREAGVSSSTLSQWLAGTYPGKEENIREKLMVWYRNLVQRETSSGLPVGPEFVETPTTRRISGGMRYAQLGPDMVVIYGAAGVSKTKTAERYRKTAPNVWIATATPASAGVAAMLEVIAEAVGIKDAPRSGATLFRLICSRVGVERSGGLLILDEAQHLSPAALDQLRAIHDHAGVGIVLMGNEAVYGRMTGGTTRAAYLDRLFSRIGKKIYVKAPVVEDVEEITAAWGITDPACAQQLREISRRPGGGGLRVLHKVLRLASSYAQAKGASLCCADVRAAVQELGVVE